ncbi:hypothetical protein GCM10023116_41910 [Kistimonas scapharcae]|uniref:Flagellar basal body rod protein FlgB n=1 Tax=Kistimonas scapharcae TaxID=1036133 RepID=A0ABP8V7Y2_9GAMM
MAIQFDQALGNQPQALAYRTSRSAILAGNLVNQETPGYHPQDLSFRHLLDVEDTQARMVRTNPLHLSKAGQLAATPDVVTRAPLQSPVNGNSVEPEREQLAFMRNATDFNRGLYFLRARLNGLSLAINGSQ